MSVSGIYSGTNTYQSRFQQIGKDFSALKTGLSSGDLTTAQQAYAALTQDLQNVQGSQSGKQVGTNSQFSIDLAAVGSALQSGDLDGAQSAFAKVTQDIQDTQQTRGGQRAYGHHHHHHHGGSSETGSSSLGTDLAAVGSALQSGDLDGAQSAFAKVMKDLGVGSAQNTTGTSGSSAFSLSITFTSISITV